MRWKEDETEECLIVYSRDWERHQRAYVFTYETRFEVTYSSPNSRPPSSRRAEADNV